MASYFVSYVVGFSFSFSSFFKAVRPFFVFFFTTSIKVVVLVFPLPEFS